MLPYNKSLYFPCFMTMYVVVPIWKFCSTIHFIRSGKDILKVLYVYVSLFHLILKVPTPYLLTLC